MRKAFYNYFCRSGAQALGLALCLAPAFLQGALPAVSLENPPQLSTDVSASPTLSWSRGALEVLVNGGFETPVSADMPLAPWQVQTVQGFGGFQIDDGSFNPNGPDGPTPPLEGQYCVTLQSFNFGGGGQYEMSQSIALPANLTDIRFSWSHLIRNYANAFSNTGQLQYYRLEVRNAGGTILDIPFTTQPGDVLFDDLNNIDPVAYFNWQKGSVNLDAYAGQTILLVFVVRTQLGNLNVRLDRMSLTGRAPESVSNEIYVSLSAFPSPTDLRGSTPVNEWPLTDLQPNTTYYWRVNSRVGNELQAGPVWQFRTAAVGAVDRFAWTTPETASAGDPFSVSLTGIDNRLHTVSGLAGTTSLSAASLATGTSFTLLNDAPHTSLNNLERTTVGYSFTPATDIWVQSVRALSGDKVSIWTDGGVLLASAPLNGIDGTWQESALETPLSLLAGKTYRVGIYTGNVSPLYSRFDADSIFDHGTIWQSYAAAGDRFPNQPHPAQWWMVDLNYIVAFPDALAVTPATSGNFSSGAWSGSVSVPQAAGMVVLLSENGTGARGYSDPIQFAGSVDNDGDGIPNDWESANGLDPEDPNDALEDDDEDGLTNGQEYVAGTDPQNPLSVLSIASITADNGSVALQFQASANRGYSVLYADSINPQAWTKLADVAPEANERTVTVMDSDPINGTRFYQVVTPQQ